MKEKSFFEKVYEVVRQIPSGRITTYGTIARFIGSPQAAKMVGWALNSCDSATDYVPAHRVVNRNGLLTGKIHFAGQNTMQELLESEGIQILHNKIVDFEKKLWSPFDEE